ncbi:hypothetical protein TNCV_3952211 [Trichonephila clavipes]|uniref:Uncharacterized protein n=1 Tax=Trichonephila clavipes TaxID=2585209 RepID=A0A8X6S0X0_TRICX|nr:hypothetical protein TNCV_3952211 [Trichonephila clavipes]
MNVLNVMSERKSVVWDGFEGRCRMGQPIGVNVHCTKHPIREQPLSSQPSQKTQKLSTQMKNHSHASRIPLLDQSPPCHSAEWKTPLLSSPASDYHDMGLRTVLTVQTPKE